jgi:hypothetical protein
MPSINNVKRPFTLICPARSGSSLIQSVFEHHPKCQSVGETGHILFYSWFGLTESEGIVVRDPDQRTPEGYRLRAADAIRELLVSFFPSSKQFWMQKPIGAPEIHWYFSARRKQSVFTEWYWIGFECMFPDARFFSVLRDPRDVVISAMDYFKVNELQAWQAIERVYDLLLHERSLVQHAILYQDLVTRPEQTLRRLCAYLGLEFDPACLSAFDYLYVQAPPEPGKTWSYRHRKAADNEKERISFSRRDSWQRLQLGEFGYTVVEKAAKLWHKFGYDLAR